MIKRLFWALLLSPTLVVQAAPEINIGTLYDYLSGPDSTQLKRIRNTSEVTAFVTVKVAEIFYDSRDEAREESLEGVDSAQRALIVTPSRLIIPAQGMQSVRLLFRGDRDRERYFRVRFLPVLPEGEGDFDLSAEESAQYRKSLAAGVNLLKAFGAILLVRPTNTRYVTHVDEPSGSFRIVNEGNASVVLEGSKECDSKGENCSSGNTYHVRPGKERVFSKQAGRVYRFELLEGDSRKSYEFKG